MKKIILSIAAVAALAACTKSEVQYEEPSEIGFVPVTKMNTKAAVADNNYPQGLDLFIFANAGDPSADVSAYTPYFRNGQFKHKAGGVFSGNPTPYYWPNVKKLIFSGYSNSGNVSTIDSSYEYFPGSSDPAKPAEWQIKLDAYAPGAGTASKGSNDLMWFPTTGPYAKPGIIGTDDDKDVNVQMQHACAWVTIIMKGNGVTAGTSPWNIKKIDMLSLSQSGNVTLGTTAAWSDLAGGTVMNIYDYGTGRPLTATGEDYTKLLDGTALVTGAKVYDLVVIPQAPKTLRVSYSFVSQKGNGSSVPDIVIDEMIDIPLATTTTTAWDPGKHYTYTITLTAEEILVEPTVNTWVDAPEEEIEFLTPTV